MEVLFAVFVADRRRQTGCGPPWRRHDRLSLEVVLCRCERCPATAPTRFSFVMGWFLGLILNFLRSSLLMDGADPSADVFIHCNNGIIPTHRLVLASMSKMLLSIFRPDTWDEQIVIMLPDFSTRDVIMCF